MQKLNSEAQGVKGVLVKALIAASNSFIMARRLLAGVDLRYAMQPASAATRLVALVTLALLAPVYALANKLVFSKVRGQVTQQALLLILQQQAILQPALPDNKTALGI